MTLLNKGDISVLPQQICNLLRKRIREGVYQPGEKLESIRKMAAALEVAPATLVRALDILESEGFVCRHQGKGVFVPKEFGKKDHPLTGCFAFPEKQLSTPSLPENDALNSALYRGLLQGAVNENMKLQFTYFEPQPSVSLLEKQLKELDKFDFVIFASDQNIELMNRIAGRKPVFCIQSCLDFDCGENIYLSDYDRLDAREKMFQLFLDSGCRSAAVVSDELKISGRAEAFLTRAASEGFRTPGQVWYVEPFNEILRLEQLQKLLSKGKYDFIFCHSTDVVRDIYEAAFNLNLRIGEDLMVAGIASGVTVGNLFPRYTYFKIPRFEQGMEIMRAASAYFRRGEPVELEVFKVRLAAGQSVKIS